MAELFPYQQVGAEYLASRARAGLLDPPGLGKTVQAITAAKLAGVRRPLIVCPAIARTHWEREWRRWWPDGPAPRIASYDRIRSAGRSAGFEKVTADLLILDEAHYLKNPGAGRTKVIYGPRCRGNGLVSRCERVWIMSGTLAPNWPSEYWTHLRALWPDLIGPALHTYDAFLRRYCIITEGLWGPKPVGVCRTEELSALLRKVMLRRRLEEVLPDLPPIVWGSFAVEKTAAHQELKALEDDPAVRDVCAEIEYRIKFGLPLVFDAESPAATLRRVIGMAKAPAVAELVADELENGAYGKIVVFAYHLDVIRALEHRLASYGAVTITGALSDNVRNRNIDRFRTADECRVLIGQLIACNTAINLSVANQVVFAETSWVPDENLQAAKRCHRIGQEQAVFVRVATLADSIDEAIARVNERKIKASEQIQMEV